MNMIDKGRRNALYFGGAATLSALFAAPLALAQSGTDATASNKRKVEEGLTAWSRGTGSVLSVLSDDIKWTIPGNSLIAGTTVGKNELNQKINIPFGARFAQSTDKFRPIAINGIYGDADMVIAHFQGRGIANDGKPYVNNYAWFLKMRDGLAVEGTAFFDSVAFNDLWTRVPVGNVRRE
ncbi:nuclear transport factor 2 family protein [Sodalis ligni]|uniref:nuclear transport factor 2 family protein n=1 Tax=Sodalis ligni TaxID=2697027 RepID=UPI001BDDD89B|nr:nuclear transport factor 2 family protein [Sodalis ligni]QWA13491.1 nuclear transport factor 2 family protein [Sodalis ligni]